MIRVEYSSNNSGGSWWLKDEDWKALEEAGWFIEWGGTFFCHSKYSIQRAPVGAVEPCAPEDDCPGHRKFTCAADVTERWLGAVAKSAWIDTESPADAIRSFEKATGQDASDDGCNCCGAPHNFSWPGGYASGDDVVAILYGESAPRSLREAAEQLARKP